MRPRDELLRTSTESFQAIDCAKSVDSVPLTVTPNAVECYSLSINKAYDSDSSDAGHACERAKQACHSSAVQNQICPQEAPRLERQEPSSNSRRECVPTCGADSKQQRHLPVGPPKVGLVRSSSDLHFKDNDETNITTNVSHHSFSHARDEPLLTESHACLSSGLSVASHRESDREPAGEANSRKQRHLPVGTSKYGIVRTRSDQLSSSDRLCSVEAPHHSTKARDEPIVQMVAASCSSTVLQAGNDASGADNISSISTFDGRDATIPVCSHHPHPIA